MMGVYSRTEEFKMDRCFNNLIIIESQCKRKVVERGPICGNLNQKTIRITRLQYLRYRKFTDVIILLDGQFDVVFIGRGSTRTQAMACEVKYRKRRHSAMHQYAVFRHFVVFEH